MMARNNIVQLHSENPAHGLSINQHSNYYMNPVIRGVTIYSYFCAMGNEFLIMLLYSDIFSIMCPLHFILT